MESHEENDLIKAMSKELDMEVNLFEIIEMSKIFKSMDRRSINRRRVYEVARNKLCDIIDYSMDGDDAVLMLCAYARIARLTEENKRNNVEDSNEK